MVAHGCHTPLLLCRSLDFPIFGFFFFFKQLAYSFRAALYFGVMHVHVCVVLCENGKTRHGARGLGSSPPAPCRPWRREEAAEGPPRPVSRAPSPALPGRLLTRPAGPLRAPGGNSSERRAINLTPLRSPTEGVRSERAQTTEKLLLRGLPRPPGSQERPHL